MLTKYIRTAAMSLAAVTILNSCQEQIDEGARFTFVGNTIATYLQSIPECSDFVEILTKGECIGLMKAYGQYTCFAPTNEAVARFLFVLLRRDPYRKILRSHPRLCQDLGRAAH